TEAGGIEIDTKGDSFFVVFRSAGSAVEASAAAQRVLAGEDWPEDVEVRVRMGLHTGEASVGNGRYGGFAGPPAARIGDARAAGQGARAPLPPAPAPPFPSAPAAPLARRALGRVERRASPPPGRLSHREMEGRPGEFPPLSTREREKAKPRMPRRRADVQVAT